VQLREDVWLLGLDDWVEGVPDPDRAGLEIRPGVFVVALFHSPEAFDQLEGRWPLALAGHTHGGQILLPWITRRILPSGCGRFLSGWYEGRRGPSSRMYVSRGVGTSALPLRLRARPELALITLVPRQAEPAAGLTAPRP
jgi:predicted MPP superfamily phosphohydrolase